MNLEISAYSEPQRQALLDLLVLAMYLDQHLGVGEDARVKRLLGAMGCDNPYDVRKQFNAAVTRVRQYAENPETACAHAARLGKVFTTQEQCREVCSLLEDLIVCDGQIAPNEKRLLDTLRDAFQLD